eukprot:677092-Amorphochlora_amoeboformis.AAC.1
MLGVTRRACGRLGHRGHLFFPPPPHPGAHDVSFPSPHPIRVLEGCWGRAMSKAVRVKKRGEENNGRMGGGRERERRERGREGEREREEECLTLTRVRPNNYFPVRYFCDEGIQDPRDQPR